MIAEENAKMLVYKKRKYQEDIRKEIDIIIRMVQLEMPKDKIEIRLMILKARIE